MYINDISVSDSVAKCYHKLLSKKDREIIFGMQLNTLKKDTRVSYREASFIGECFIYAIIAKIRNILK